MTKDELIANTEQKGFYVGQKVRVGFFSDEWHEAVVVESTLLFCTKLPKKIFKCYVEIAEEYAWFETDLIKPL